ncbi:MAG: TerC family protein [Rhodospirillaceae bacterium]|nr:TerC family protein [Rhodospirillaceae bacterium]
MWANLLTIIGINIVLSGDNAVVIALACRTLPPRQRTWGVACGAGAAVLLRIVFTLFIAFLLTVQFLKIAGGLLLFWVGYKLMTEESGEDDVDAGANLWHAVRIVVIADAVMSLDNVIAVAAAAHGNTALLIAGLVISIPMVVYGATLLIKLIERFPVIVPAGAALIGYIGGEVLVTDAAIHDWLESHLVWLRHVAPLMGAVAVILVSRIIKPKAQPESPVQEAAAGAGVFAGRAVLTRIAAFLIGGIGYVIGEPVPGETDGALVLALHALLPIFAAVIAIVLGEFLARHVRRAQVA